MLEREPHEKVRLYLKQAKLMPWEFDDSTIPPVPKLVIQPSQIRGYYSLFGTSQDHDTFQCLVDTGAMLTLIPKEVWKLYEKQIGWLYTTNNSLTDTKIGGASVKFRLGVVTIHFLDFDKRVLTRQIIAGCIMRVSSIKSTILGLGFGNAATAGGLCLNFVDDSLWLVSV